MTKPFAIIIADRNPHIRNLLKREIQDDSHCIELADSGYQLLDLVFNENKEVDLMVIDPDFPDIDAPDLLMTLQTLEPAPRIVLHAFHSNYIQTACKLPNVTFVEKDGGNIEHLETLIRCILISERQKGKGQ